MQLKFFEIQTEDTLEDQGEQLGRSARSSADARVIASFSELFFELFLR